jgi:hypothetical protein
VEDRSLSKIKLAVRRKRNPSLTALVGDSTNAVRDRREGFISVIAGFSFIGIMLGVATLIIVMAVMSPCLSGAENEACPGIGAKEFVRHFSLDHVVERLTSAVKWNDIVDVHILHRCDCVAHVVFLIGCKVEAPDDRVNFIDARSRLRLFDRVDHAAMTARS